MKKFVVVVAALGLLLGGTGVCWAAYYGPVVMVEADPTPPGTLDGETKVEFTVNLFGSDWIPGEWVDGGFTAFEDEDNGAADIQVTKEAGTVVDFAIQNGSDVLKLSDGDQPVTFQNKNSGIVEKPTWVKQWYDDFYIMWQLDDGSSMKLEFITTDGDPDGVAPVPVPASLMLLGGGLMVLVGIRRRY